MSQLIIEAKKSRLSLNIAELIEYRELLGMMAYRDVKIRYAQSVLGILWVLIQPIVTLVIFSLVFGRAIKVQTGDIPYPLFALAGMCLWGYFSNVMSQAGNSIIGAQGMVKKIYFPRLIIPLSKSIASLVDFGVTVLFLLGMMIYYQFAPSSNILWSIVAFLMTLVASTGIGLWLSAMTIRFRDLLYVLPFLVQIGLYATPVAYPTSLVPPEYLTLYYLNPMAGIVDFFRWSVFGTPLNAEIWISFVVSLILFISGLYYFRSVESVIADIV
jgi:lipopolysaccharide transport system permease protein